MGNRLTKIEIRRTRGLDGVALGPGDALLVAGPNGSGKSALLMACAGLLPLTAVPDTANVREILLDGRPPSDPRERPRLIWLPQNVGLPEGTVRFALEWASGLARDADTGEAQIVDGPLGPALRPLLPLRVGALSDGQRRLVSAAMALSMRPRVVLVDEPEANLDDRHREILGDALASAREGEGLIVIAATPSLATAIPLLSAHQLRLDSPMEAVVE